MLIEALCLEFLMCVFKVCVCVRAHVPMLMIKRSSKYLSKCWIYNLWWGKSSSWSHDVFSSVNVALSWVFPAAGQKWYCYAYLCVCHKKKKKKILPGSLAVSPLFPVLAGVLGSDSIRTSWAEITERLQLISIQEAFFLTERIKSCWHILKYWPCRGAFPSLQSFNQLCSGCEPLMKPRQHQQRQRVDERTWSTRTSCTPQR